MATTRNGEQMTPNPFPVDHRWQIHEMARRNAEAGYHWFDADTMRWFGDRMTSFVAVHAEGKTYIKRIRNGTEKPASVPSEIGKLYAFDPETGKIDTITNDMESDAELRAAIPAELLKGNRYYKGVIK